MVFSFGGSVSVGKGSGVTRRIGFWLVGEVREESY
jgi:hypothetical protein